MDSGWYNASDKRNPKKAVELRGELRPMGLDFGRNNFGFVLPIGRAVVGRKSRICA
jgi:hypothetical protein